MTRNPKWTREEMILALDLYHRIDPLRVTSSQPEILQLSRQLRSCPFHSAQVRASTFRNPAGIVMTLRTFMRYDPALHHRGLRGGKTGRELWDEFAGRRSELSQLAQAIIAAGETIRINATELGDDEVFEGGVLFRLHRLRERNRWLVERKKAHVRRQQDRLRCEVCDFDFVSTYGPLGEGFVECHHCRPLGEMPGRAPVRLADLALVCSNCHRMLHRQQPLITVDSLRKVVWAHRSEATGIREVSLNDKSVTSRVSPAAVPRSF